MIKDLLILGAALITSALGLLGQARLDPALLGKPPVDAWPTYHGDYSGRHYSTLKQINQANVKSLVAGAGDTIYAFRVMQ